MKKIRATVIMTLCILLLCALFAACSKLEEEERYPIYDVTFVVGEEESFVLQSDENSGKIGRPEDPVREGYVFVDWFYEAGGDQAVDFDSIVETDKVFYAKWEKEKTKIRFEGNGSTSGAMSDLYAESGSVFKLPPNEFSREGYTFIGWADMSDGNVKNKDGGWFYTDSIDTVTLFACWQPNRYTVSLDLQGGEAETDKVTAIYDDNLPTFKIPSKVGYLFDGFFTQTDGKGVKYYDSVMHSCRKYCLPSDTVLYANWVEARNKLSFDGNGSTSGGTAYIETSTSQDIILPECGFSRTGYTFVAWNTKADGSGDAYSCGDKFVMPVSDDGVVLYACWIANRYTVYFDSGTDGERISQTHIYDTEQDLLPNGFMRYGYRFVAWSDVKDGPGNYFDDMQKVLNLCDQPDGEVFLYAVWTPKNVTVNLNKSGGKGGTNYVEVTYGANFPSAIAPSKVGYTFGGYFSRESGQGKMYLDHNMRPVSLSDLGEDVSEIFAYWIPRSNNVIFEPNGGGGQAIELITATDDMISLRDYTFDRKGYSLSGWSTMADGSGEFFAFGSTYSVPAKNTFIRLYAVWTANPVTMIFAGNGNDGGNVDAIETSCAEQIVLPDCEFVKTGYKCVGWSAVPDGSLIYELQSPYTVPETDLSEIKLFAQWELEKYSVTYDLNGGVNSPYNPSYYTYLSGDISLSNPTKRGYNFTGWEGDSPITAGSTGDKIYIATWDCIKYSVEIQTNGGDFENGFKLTYYTVKDDTIYIPDPVKEGSTFEGWLEGNCIPAGSIGDKTFTARWTGINYTITYNLDGGQNGAGNPGSYMKDSDDFTLKDPKKEGYRFIGWLCQEMEINTATKPITVKKGSQGNLTFVAQWEIVTYKIDYILNGGTNSPNNPDEYQMSDDDIKIYDPTRAGYIFEGWLEGGVIAQNTTGDLTFTAVWKAITYELSIFEIKDEDAEPVVIKFDIDSEDIVIAIVDGEAATYSISTGSSVVENTVINAGYRLVGWYEVSDESIVTAEFTLKKGSIGNRFVMAKWELIEYSIEYVVDDDVINDNPDRYTVIDEIILKEPTRKGYAFAGWEDQDGQIITQISEGSIGDMILTAKWTKSTDPVDPDPVEPENPDPENPDPVDPDSPDPVDPENPDPVDPGEGNVENQTVASSAKGIADTGDLKSFSSNK